jgi:hypothetical protein
VVKRLSPEYSIPASRQAQYSILITLVYPGGRQLNQEPLCLGSESELGDRTRSLTSCKK